MGSTMVALRATDLSAEADPNARYILASSLTSSPPTLPVGTEKQLRRHCKTLVYMLSSDLTKSGPLMFPHVKLGGLRLGYSGSEGPGSTVGGGGSLC